MREESQPARRVARRRHPVTDQLVPLGIVAILAGYLLPWVPLEPAGLQLIGLELGEWVKFLPEVQAGLTPNRLLFYLPPLTSGLMLILLAAGWPPGRWQNWAARGLGLALAWLAFPALQAIRLEPAAEWRLRLIAVAIVGLAALAGPVLARLPSRFRLVLILGLALGGAAGPTWAFVSLRPVLAAWLREPVGLGPGLWLNGAGHLLVGAASWLGVRRAQPSRPG